MILDFPNKTKLQKDALIGEGYFYLQEAAELGKSLEIVEAKEKKPIKTNDPRVFYFQQSNKANLLTVRGLVGKEIDRRLKNEPFEDFKIVFGKATPPSDEQRGYYRGVVLPTIQEHYKKQGNFMKEDELHEAIKNCLKDEEGIISERINPITGEVYKTMITTSNAGNKKEVAQFIDAVIRWAATEGIYIPEANKCRDAGVSGIF